MDDHEFEGGFTVVFESAGEEPGLEIVDPIERRRRSLGTPAPVSPEPIGVEPFPFPVETAVAIETPALSMPTAEQVFVRDPEGQMIDDVDHGVERSFPAGDYTIEPSGMGKVYLRVDAAVDISPDGHATEIAFGEPARVKVGCRSTHRRPAATVTTTPDPADVLATVSTFGSALKTTSPERSFASFRGHPPTVEVGSELDVPDGLEPPADDLRIEVPAQYRYAFPAAPLAYYLGVPVREGPEPRLLGDGIDHDLTETGSFEDGVEELLKHVFVLEAATRTEGLYRLDVHERAVVEERVDLDFAELYDAPQPERLRAYLDVPHELVADVVPDWQNAAHVEPDVESVEALPYLLDDLALVRIAEPDAVSPDVVASGGLEGLTRGGPAPAQGASAPTSVGSARTRSGTVPTGSSDAAQFVTPSRQTDAIEETWVGDGTPIGATKALTEAYENRIGRTASTGSIDISVVCNADAMTEERDLVDQVYGSRANLPFDVTVERDVTTEALADLLAEPRDFLHYVGHIDDDGFECADGHLDAAGLDEVGVDAFFLNACQSYDQGIELIRNGAIGGIATIRDVVNFGAIRIGRAVARLLNSGFPLRPALEIARDESVVGSLYVVVGDGGLSIVQCQSGTPMLLEVEGSGEQYSISLDLFGVETGMGGVYFPFLDANEQYYLASGTTDRLTVDADDLESFLELEEFPVRVGEQLRWSSNLTVDDL